MTKEAFDKIADSLQQALDYVQGDTSTVTMRTISADDLDVVAIRKRLGLSQDRFALLFGLNVGTIRGWEQHQRQPTGPARTLLRVIEKEPKAVLEALESG